jgi:hypothetical protein
MDDAETDSPGVESEDVITYLRKLRLRHGNPSCRIIAQAVGTRERDLTKSNSPPKLGENREDHRIS